VKIQNIGNNNGVIACAILKPRKVLVNCRIRIQDHVNTNKRKRCDFEFSDIKPGNYAIAVIHDENRNELDTNMFGIPKEGYGFPVVQRSQ
jgi:uncharacterized protein (DUF2141 family)